MNTSSGTWHRDIDSIYERGTLEMADQQCKNSESLTLWCCHTLVLAKFCGREINFYFIQTSLTAFYLFGWLVYSH